jgi:hypothetical protein
MVTTIATFADDKVALVTAKRKHVESILEVD